jgi:hypothetical protein
VEFEGCINAFGHFSAPWSPVFESDVWIPLLVSVPSEQHFGGGLRDRLLGEGALAASRSGLTVHQHGDSILADIPDNGLVGSAETRPHVPQRSPRSRDSLSSRSSSRLSSCGK